MKYLYSIGLILLGMIVPVFAIINSIRFDQECGGFLKQTADANTAEIALERLNIAIAYAEAHNLTSGYTSVLWKTEDENIGFWYRNLKACQSELEACLDGTQLEKSNVLMKVRESLTDSGKDHTQLTIPTGISRYPKNAWFLVLGWMSAFYILAGLIFGICHFFASIDY